MSSPLKMYKSIFAPIVAVMVICPVLFSQAWGQTYVSGKVLTADGMVVASGAVALEKGELHNNAFLAGGEVNADGTFKIPLPSGGPWGLHVYSEKYIYFPLQIQVKKDVDNDVPVILPVDGTTADDPQISNIRFNKITNQVIQVSMAVTDPNRNLGPQMLAIDTKRFKAYRLVPEKGDLKDWKAAFPQGKYVSPHIPAALNDEDRKAWLFVVADHQCSNGPVLNGLGQSVFKQPVAAEQVLTCDLPGIWKSNFDKLYRFSLDVPGVYKGEQLEGNLIVDSIAQKDNQVRIDYRFEGQKGTAQLDWRCKKSDVVLQGTYSLPGRSGEWIFTKIQDAKLNSAQLGQKLFSANCAFCHFTDSANTKVGPGLKGLFGRAALQSSGRPVNEDTVQKQIVRGGEEMPPFNHLKEEEVKALIEYLKSL